MNMRGANYNHDLSMIKEASRFGWDYINLNYSIDGFKESLKYKEELIEEASRLERPVEIDMGINLRNSNSDQHDFMPWRRFEAQPKLSGVIQA